MDWVPKTRLGKQVAEGAITIDEIFRTGRKIKEPEIADRLIPGLRDEIIFIGGSPGKGGGIRRTPTRRSARMHRSGRRFRLTALAVVGNGDGYIGIGVGKSQDHRESIQKAVEDAKLNIIPIRRGCGSWECACDEKHSIPIEVEGKCGSVTVRLLPAPKGIGLAINDEAKKIMRLSGVRDIWSKSFGETRTRMNYAFALVDAFKKMNRMKLEHDHEFRTEKEELQQLEEEAAESAESGEPAESEKETEMGFAESVVPEILDGKTRTWRLREHRIEEGDAMDFVSSTGEIFGTGKITKIEKTTVGEIDLKDKAHYKTYASVDELIEAFKKHNSDYEVDKNTDVYVYTYEFTPAEKGKEKKGKKKEAKTEKEEKKKQKGEKDKEGGGKKESGKKKKEDKKKESGKKKKKEECKEEKEGE